MAKENWERSTNKLLKGKKYTGCYFVRAKKKCNFFKAYLKACREFSFFLVTSALLRRRKK